MDLPTTTRVMVRKADVPSANVWPLYPLGIFLKQAHQTRGKR